MDYWVNADGETSMWYLTDDGSYNIGPHNFLGTSNAFIIGITPSGKKCPNDEGFVWYYGENNAFHQTNDLHIICKNNSIYMKYMHAVFLIFKA